MTQTKLIRNYFFGNEPTTEVLKQMKALTPVDKSELASAVARELKCESECQFDLVPY